MRRRRAGLSADRRTVALGGLAAVAVAALVAVEYGRVWRRGSAPMPQEADDLLTAAETAAAQTAEVAVAGYRETPTRENSLFNLLSSFVATFLAARTITYLLRTRRTVGPFRDLRLGRRRIHHFVPGIVIAFVAGAVAIITRDERVQPKLAVPFGIGVGLTLDESALLLQLEDVYWTREGLLSVQITLAVTAGLASLALGLRFLRRGEQVVLESSETAPRGV
jgi:hypothetical protein